MDYEVIVKLSPEQLAAATEAYFSQDKGFYMGGYIAGYVPCGSSIPHLNPAQRPHADATSGSFLVDAIFLGVILHQFAHWWQWSRKEDRWVVQSLVVRCPSSLLSSPRCTVLMRGRRCSIVLYHDCQSRYIRLVSRFAFCSLQYIHGHNRVIAELFRPQPDRVDLSYVCIWLCPLSGAH